MDYGSEEETFTEYYWLGDTLLGLKISGDGFENAYGLEDYTLTFFYDESGNPLGMNTPDGTYYYSYNLQGDVIGLIDENGDYYCNYVYDAWGKCNYSSLTGDFIIDANPFRYRGYIYDAETGFYYLQSRYYDPQTGRFLNADGLMAGVGESVQGYNLFAYCMNNPVNMFDYSGTLPEWLTGTLNIIGGALQVCVQRGTMMIANGHHRVAVLSKYGVKTIKVFLVP